MASIKLDSRVAVEACEKAEKRLLEYRHEISKRIDEIRYSDNSEPWVDKRIMNNDHIWYVDKLKKLAEYSPDLTIDINEQDFELIGEYLPKETK